MIFPGSPVVIENAFSAINSNAHLDSDAYDEKVRAIVKCTRKVAHDLGVDLQGGENS